MQSQDELFGELPHATNPHRDFLCYRVGEKIIPVPCTVWKDGRIRADLSPYGGGTPTHRNRENLDQRIIEVLEKVFGDAIEAVREELKRKPARRAQVRISNKLASRSAQTNPAREYINPFLPKLWTFAKCPDWLFSRREPSATEKRVYAKLLFPARPICRTWDQTRGVILGLDQGELANALGVRRPTVNLALKSLEARALIEMTGGAGAKQCVRFLWHPWMPEETRQTCTLNVQVCDSPPVRSLVEMCTETVQPAVRSPVEICTETVQVTQSIEEREQRRQERETEGDSPSPTCPWAAEPHLTAAELQQRRAIQKQ